MTRKKKEKKMTEGGKRQFVGNDHRRKMKMRRGD